MTFHTDDERRSRHGRNPHRPESRRSRFRDVDDDVHEGRPRFRDGVERRFDWRRWSPEDDYPS